MEPNSCATGIAGGTRGGGTYAKVYGRVGVGAEQCF